MSKADHNNAAYNRRRLKSIAADIRNPKSTIEQREIYLNYVADVFDRIGDGEDPRDVLLGPSYRRNATDAHRDHLAFEVRNIAIAEGLTARKALLLMADRISATSGKNRDTEYETLRVQCRESEEWPRIKRMIEHEHKERKLGKN